MNTGAIILMVITQVLVTGFTVYFFALVLKSPKKPEPDSYTDNDPEYQDEV